MSITTATRIRPRVYEVKCTCGHSVTIQNTTTPRQDADKAAEVHQNHCPKKDEPVNIYSSRGGVVHRGTSYGLPMCGALNRPGISYVPTEQGVTCKRCEKY